MIELTEKQLQFLDANPEPRLFDPRTNKAYVLVSADLYQKLRDLVMDDDMPDMRQVATLVEGAMRDDDADDPTLDYYRRTYGSKP